HPGDRQPVEQGIGIEVEAVKVAVLGGNHQNLLAACGLDNGWSAGNVPIVPVFWNDLEMVLVSPGHRVEDANRARIHVRPLTHVPTRGMVSRPVTPIQPISESIVYAV